MGDAGADEGFHFSAGFGVKVSSRGQAGREAEAFFGDRVDGAAHEDAGFDPVREHSVELDAWRNAANMTAGRYSSSHLPPIVDAGVEHVLLFAVKVFGGKDLDVAEAVIDRAFAQPPEHAGKEAANQQ